MALHEGMTTVLGIFKSTYIQWKLGITRPLGRGHFVCYIRYFVISVVNKQHKTKEIHSLGLEKFVCYISSGVISDLFISSFHCIVTLYTCIKGKKMFTIVLYHVEWDINTPISFSSFSQNENYNTGQEGRIPIRNSKKKDTFILWFMIPADKVDHHPCIIGLCFIELVITHVIDKSYWNCCFWLDMGMFCCAISYIHWASKETYHFFKATHIKIQSI